ncbi:MAG: ThiF family adenylyltransferase [Sulfurimonas sp.]|jgi:molybdopterin/thiamine biosynthesis adenylyltransferase|nr:ThiF family adenylyltransferase [Sulfurimonadaceae bacterium]
MREYFHRQIQLWGEDTQKSLQDKKVLIVGAGGLGSSLGFALGSSGIGELHLVDFDDVSLHNIHRQIAFKLGDEGKNKASINADVIKSRCSFVDVFAYDIKFDEFIKSAKKFDLIIDATDNIQTRREIDTFAKNSNTPWIYGTAEAFHGQVAFFDKSSYNDSFRAKDHTPAGITAPIVMHIASLEALIALRYLAGLEVKKDLLYYLYFNSEGELITQKFKL